MSGGMDDFNMLMNLTGGGGGAGGGAAPSGGYSLLTDSEGVMGAKMGTGIETLSEQNSTKLTDPLKMTPFGILSNGLTAMQGFANAMSLQSMGGGLSLGSLGGIPVPSPTIVGSALGKKGQGQGM